MMLNPHRLIPFLALILLFNLAAPAQSEGSQQQPAGNQQQPAGNQTNQNPQQPAGNNPDQTPQQSEENQKKNQQQPAESKSAQKPKETEEQKTSQNPQQPEGWEGLGYLVHQSIEVGYRVSDVSGSQQMYSTLVNLPQGPRLLEQTLSMQSPNHEGLLFDNLFINTFGWGGDPNNAASVRVDKGNWYDFRMSFRRDHNDFDYNLLANPLNPPTSSPSIPVTSSPHGFSTRRRMYDYDLTLLPQSVVTFRLGYSRNNMTGPSFSSVHEGTDALLFQQWDTTLNSYRFGVDVKLVPHTVISFDQFLDYTKDDTNWQLAPFAPALLPGPPGSVELGLPIDTGNKNPCAPVAPATSLIDSTGTLTNLGCNGFFSYTRPDRVRTTLPTERISLHSDYFHRFEFNASYAYGWADSTAPLNEFFNGLISRSRTRQTTVTGTGEASSISNVADFSAIVHLTKHFRLVETFRFWAYRIPETGNFIETDFNVPGSGSCNPPTCSLLTPISATTPNVTPTLDQLSFNQNWWRNQDDLVWDGSKHYGGRIGFRYGDKIFHHFLDFTGDEDRTVVHEYTPLFAFWAKPMTTLRFNFDWEHPYYDDAIVRIGPRKESRYRIQANYTPRPWAVLGASVNLWNASNSDVLTNYRAHSRNYGFTATIAPEGRVGLELAYTYSDYLQSGFVCFNDSDTTLPTVANAGSCVANGFNDSNNPLLIDGRYTNLTHYAFGLVTLKPVQRLNMQVGYSITSVGGEIPQFNSLQPLGPLSYNYHQPLANLAFDLGHNLTAKAGWNFYQYGEKSFIGPTDGRNFHSNNETLSLRWAF